MSLHEKPTTLTIGELLIKSSEAKQSVAKLRRDHYSESRKYLEQLVGRGQVKRTIEGVKKK